MGGPRKRSRHGLGTRCHNPSQRWDRRTIQAGPGQTQPVVLLVSFTDPPAQRHPVGRYVGPRGYSPQQHHNDGQGQEWHAVDIVAAHNATQSSADQIDPDTRRAWRSVEEMRHERQKGFTSSYTELIALDENTLLLIYDRIGFGWHAIPDDSSESKSVWVMRLRVL